LEYSGKIFANFFQKREKILTFDVAITHGSYLAFKVEINVIMKTNLHLWMFMNFMVQLKGINTF
jgi:predicted transport protein